MIPGITASVASSASTLAFSAPLTEDLVDDVGAATPTFVRATLATIPDDSDTLVTCASGEPQFEGSTRNAENDWTATASSLGARIEKAATNLIQESQDFGTWWANSWNGGTTHTSNAAVAPDGTTTADELAQIDATGDGNETPNISLTTGTDYNAALYIKNVDSTESEIIVNRSGVGELASVDITWTAGVPSTGASSGMSDIKYESVGSSWYRFSGTVTAAATANHRVIIIPQRGTVATNSIYVWQCDLIASSYVTTPIKTSGAAATRDKTEAEHAITLKTNDFTIACDWTPQHDSGATDYILTSYSDADNFVALMYDGSDVIFRKRIAGSNNDAVKTTNVVAGTTYRLVGRLDSSAGVSLWVDTVKGTDDATTTNAVVGTALELGALTGGSQTTQNVKLAAYHTAALADVEAAAL